MKKNAEKETVLKASQILVTYNKLVKDQTWVSKQNENCGMFIHTVEQSQIKSKKVTDDAADDVIDESEDEDEINATTMDELMEKPEFRLFG